MFDDNIFPATRLTLYEGYVPDAPKFLTPESKVIEQGFLRQAIRAGDVDTEMISYLTALNKITGVCSQFCCVGHIGRIDGYIIVLVDEAINRLLWKEWQAIAFWAEVTGVSTDILLDNIRWTFRWEVGDKSYYNEFMTKFNKLLSSN